MVARARNYSTESFKRYRANLEKEERSLKARLEGRNWHVRVAPNPQVPSLNKGLRMRGLDGTMFGTFKHRYLPEPKPE